MATQSGKFAVSGYQIGRVHGLPSLAFAYPVLDAHKNILAVAYASLNLGVFEEQAELQTSSRLGVARVLTIFDHSGIVIGQFPKSHAKVGEKGRNAEVLKRILAQKRGLFTALDPSGQSRVFAFDSVGLNPDGKAALHVLVSTSTDSIYAQADAALRDTAIGIIVLTVLLLLLAWFGAELIVTRRFRTLLAMTDRVRAGDFSARCGFDEGEEEFAQLGHAFDAMAGELQDRDTRLQEALERLRAQAITDELTGLYNRRHLWNALEAELVRARRKRAPLSVLLFDIDHFKQLNDQWGHEAGDLVLQNLAQAVRRVVRGTDIVARHGGEEFVVVMPEAGEEVALLRARQLRAKLAEMRLSYQGQTLKPITISVGVVVSSDASHSGEILVREADAAMYEAKTRGRDQVVLRRLASA
jgi:diguanylate cyclase (GGDEF)-like protein